MLVAVGPIHGHKTYVEVRGTKDPEVALHIAYAKVFGEAPSSPEDLLTRSRLIKPDFVVRR